MTGRPHVKPVVGKGRVPGHLPEQIARRLKHEILEGRFAHNERFPSHRVLCRRTGAGLKTVRLALDLLEADGLIYRRQRSGTFVRPRPGSTSGPGRCGLDCINIIEPEQPDVRAAIRADYKIGYAEALEESSIAIRFVGWEAVAGNAEAAYSREHARRRQGFILLNVLPGEFMVWLLKKRAPFVVQHFCYYPTQGLPEHHRIFVNKVGGAFEGTRHLLDLGHRRIVYAGRMPEPDALPAVFEGYRTALLCAGLGVDASNVLGFSTDNINSALPPVREWFETHDRPEAFFAQTDAMAMAVLQVAAERGLRVPRDLSVVGFNDLPEAAKTDPPLTTVADPRRQLAREAMDMLLRTAFSRENPFETHILNCHLVVRGSAVPASGSL